MSWVADPVENNYMPRLIVHVEGETEETFVNEVLAPHLYKQGYSLVSARLIGNARQRQCRGGIRAWSVVRNDIINHIKQDQECWITTMVDFYALPKTGRKAWPGRQEASNLPFKRKAETVELALFKDVCNKIDRASNDIRFIPYVSMHEYEGLLFSNCKLFGEGIGRPDLTPFFQEIRDQFGTPEEINDSPNTAPSKRIEQLVPRYPKIVFGSLAAKNIGLENISVQCPNFRKWLEHLESLTTI